MLHRLHHLHHQAGNAGPDAAGPGCDDVDVKVTISGENGEDEVIDVPIWNGTVANIVLMSLGGQSTIMVDPVTNCPSQVRDLPRKFCSPSLGFSSMTSSRTSWGRVSLWVPELSIFSSSPPSVWPSFPLGRPGGSRPTRSSSSP